LSSRKVGAVVERGRVILGRVTKPQGLKGEVRVALLGGSADVFRQCAEVRAVREGTPERLLTLESIRVQGRVLVAKFAGVQDRAAAECLVGHDLEIAEDDVPDLPDGEYYTFQLEGLEVVTVAGERLGILEEVLDLPAHDVYVVRQEDREVLLPATEEVVKEIDLGRRRMVVRLLEGLME